MLRVIANLRHTRRKVHLFSTRRLANIYPLIPLADIYPTAQLPAANFDDCRCPKLDDREEGCLGTALPVIAVR